MTTDLDRAVRTSLGDLIAAAPEPNDQPVRLVAVGSETRLGRPYLALAASLVVLAGVGGLVAIGTNDTSPGSLGAAPIATDESSAPLPEATMPGDTASSAVVNATLNCAIAGAQALVPNVAGMPWVDADAVLATAGLKPNSLPELPPPFVDATDSDYYFIIRQAPAPDTITTCGAIVDITVAYRPGILYVVQEGDTYQSIAASQGVTLEQFLSFNGLSLAALEGSGQSSADVLARGQALRLSRCPTSWACSGPSTDPGTLNTVPTGTDPATLDTAPATTS